MDLNTVSVLSLWSAVAVYAIAFVSFSLDLARRSAAVTAAQDVAASTSAVPVAASASAVGTVTAVKKKVKDRDASAVPAGNSASLRVGISLTILAFVLHVTAIVTRGVDAGRVPWANMYEFAMTGTALIIAVFLVVLTRVDLRFLGSFVVGLVVLMLGLCSLNFYVAVVPLPPALQSAWLIIHVFVASLATGFFIVGFALTIVQLIQSRREKSGTVTTASRMKFLATLPSAERMENLAYRVNIVGFILWTFTLMAGAVWAEAAWGRYWGWDTKEVWTFIIWVIYAGYIHARATRGWRGNRAAWLSVIGALTVLFNFTVVNLFFKGLHAYSGL